MTAVTFQDPLWLKLKDWLKYPLEKEDMILNAQIDLIDKRFLNIQNDPYIPEPLGISSKHRYNLNLFPPEDAHALNSEEILLAINRTTDRPRLRSGKRGTISKGRDQIVRSFEQNGIRNKNGLSSKPYILQMKRHKFIISPEGNGIDCHRHYEAFYSKGVPVIPRNRFIKSKFCNLPVIWTDDYSEINESYLNKKYNSMLNNTYDFSFILLSRYPPPLQEVINRRSLFWMNKSAWKKKYEKYLP